MKRLKLKRWIAGLLLGAMVTCGTSAFANVSTAEEQYPYDPPYYTSIKYASDLVKPKAQKSLPDGWETNCNPDKTRVQGVKVSWYDVGTGYLRVKWKTKSSARGYEVQLSRYKNFRTYECLRVSYGTGSSCTLHARQSKVFNPKKHKTYYIRVRSTYDRSAPSPWSKTVQFKAKKANALPDKF